MSSYENRVRFTKMQGVGNDYVYIDALDIVPPDLPLLSRRISDRHYGVGGDGLVAITRSGNADFAMRMFNNDGSEARMCGNACRCIGKYLYERGLTDKTEITLETLAGIRRLQLTVDDGKVVSVRVDMGIPSTSSDILPVLRVASGSSGVPEVEIRVGVNTFRLIPVDMGNPHGVLFCPCTGEELMERYGKALSTDTVWPEQANIEFVKIISRTEIEMWVWERGTGPTLACGTGACAAVVAGVLTDRLDRHVRVRLTGGILDVEWDEKSGHVFLSGGAEIVAEGEYFPETAMPDGQLLIGKE